MSMMDNMIASSLGGGALGTLFVTLTANSTQLVRGMQQAEMSVKGGSANILKAAAGMALGVTAALTGVGIVAVREFAKFDAALTESMAIMGKLSEETKAQLSTTARDVARNSIVSAEEAAKSFYFLASAGLDASQSIAALPLVQKFATAGAFNMAQATEMLADANSALGLSVKDAAQNLENLTRVGDVLVRAATLANASVEQLATSLTREAAATMKAFSIDVEEGTAVLAAFADQGIKGEIAGTGFSRIIRMMSSEATSNAQAFAALNVQVFDSENNIRNLADVIGDLEKALLPLSDAQRVTALESMGFRAELQGILLPLIGTAEKIRGFERELRSAGGYLQEVSDNQMLSFSNQLKMTQNRFVDLLITIGEGLAPVLGKLNEMLQDALDTNTSLGRSVKGFSEEAGPALLIVLDGIVKGMELWRAASNGLQFAIVGSAEVTLRVWQAVGKGIASVVNFIVNSVIGAVNAAVTKINDLLDSLPSWLSDRVGFARATPLEFELDLNFTALDNLVEIAAETRKEIASELITAGQDAIGIVGDSVESVVKEVVDHSKEMAVEAAAVAAAEVSASLNSTKELIALRNAASIEAGSAMSKMGISDTGDIQGGVRFNDPNIDRSNQLMAERSLMEQHLRELQVLSEQDALLNEQTLERKRRAHEQYSDNLREIQYAQRQMVLATASTMFGDMTTMAQQFAGEQSGVYQAMFAASKAFAIAESIVKIQQGIAAAASMPWPTNLAAIASVVAATANIVSTIRSVKLTFGGERAEGGPVSAGRAFLVGEEGPELFVPKSNGGIIPNDMLQGGSGRGVNVVINNYTDARPEVREREEGGERTVEVIIQRVKTEIGSEIRDGRGTLTKAMETTFNLRRGVR